MLISTGTSPVVFPTWPAFSHALEGGQFAGKGVFPILVGQEPLVVKAAGGDRRNYSWFRYALVALIVRHLVGQRPDRRVLMRTAHERLAHEAARLNRLKAQGVAVPAVRLQLPDLLVLQDVGEPVDQALVPLPQPSRMALIERIANDLTEFHQAGHWHGAGQLRNMTLQGDRLFRIDFEEDLEGVLPLAHCQALDVLLAAFSLAHHRDLDNEDHKESLIRQLVIRWRQRMKGFRATREFDRMVQSLRWPASLAQGLGFVKGRDVVAFRVLARSLLGANGARAMPPPG
jgi:tRNA A-37 threonylcarbamoyl transferase component Bud32